MLAINEEALACAGIYVPKTGRIDPDLAGHHNLAWQLYNPYQFDRNAGTLDEMFDEIRRADMPTVCVSSEEFEFLGAHREKLQELFDGFLSVGYEPCAVLYLRPQADYLESLYATIIKRWTVDFSDFVGSIIANGSFGESQFNYYLLIKNFERVFGAAGLRIKRFRSEAAPKVLLSEFLEIICDGGGTIDRGAIRWPARLNTSLKCDEVLAVRAELLGEDASESAGRSMRPSAAATIKGAEFAPLTLFEVVQILVSCWPSNDRIWREYGVHISGATRRMLRREISATVIANEAQREKKRLMRSIGKPDVPSQAGEAHCR
jgi:hypothetical protein